MTQSNAQLSVAPANGCYGWPRCCEHNDDLDCLLVESLKDPEFAREWARIQARPKSSRERIWENNQRTYRKSVAVKPSLSRRGWRRG